MLHHPEVVYAIGRDRLSKRLIIGWQGGPTQDVAVGHYQWHAGEWHWFSPEEAKC
jgi:hypothetical protein